MKKRRESSSATVPQDKRMSCKSVTKPKFRTKSLGEIVIFCKSFAYSNDE